jgi:hypothetical protein
VCEWDGVGKRGGVCSRLISCFGIFFLGRDDEEGRGTGIMNGIDWIMGEIGYRKRNCVDCVLGV